MNHPQNLSSAHHQQGFVLVVALILLLILTLIGVAATQRTTLEEKMAGNAQNQSLAFQSAEAALRLAEGGTEAGLWSAYAGNTAGQYLFDPTVTPQWLTATGTLNTAFLNTPANMLNYNTVSGLTFPGVVSPPSFMIEQMPPVPAPGQSLGLEEYGSGVPQIQVYRITALGLGGDSNAQVVLQSTYRP